MKKITMMFALVAGTVFSACSQTINASRVPAAVRNAFAKKYPGLTATWEKEDGKFEAGFKQHGTTMSVTFDADGTMAETEMDIKVSELPATVLTYVKGHYKGKTIKTGAKITKADGNVNYEAELDGKDVIFDSNGNFVKEAKD